MSGSYGGHGHSHSQSLSIKSAVRERDADGDAHSDGSGAGSRFTTPLARRTTLSKTGITAIPTPSGLPRRQSGGGMGRRTSIGVEGEMGPPERPGRQRKLSEVGETY
jgi:hypothetical protein